MDVWQIGIASGEKLSGKFMKSRYVCVNQRYDTEVLHRRPTGKGDFSR